MRLTVFTPTYNRAYLLNRLYQSLKQQNINDFEWIIVDDGSVDDTKEIVESFIAENLIPITYFYKKNEGKHIAINKGVELAKGDLFFIVDSDDILPEYSLEVILKKYEKVKRNNLIAGVSGRKGYIKGGYIGTNLTYEDMVLTSIELRMKKKIKGDMAEVYRTEILKKYPFPKFEGENFCTEGLVWQRIDQNYKMLWFSDIIYKAEYLEGGLTFNSIRLRKNNPKATALYYAQLSKYNIPFFEKVKAIANYWRFSIYNTYPLSEKIKQVSLLYSLISIPIAIVLIIKDRI